MTAQPLTAMVFLLACWCSSSGVLAASSPSNFELPSNATVVNGGPIVTGFSCDGLKYGYYADVNNDCRVFHVCAPYLDADNFIKTIMYSFICGQGTVFDQATLTCNHVAAATNCAEAPGLYSVNDYFGQTDVNFGEKK
ncbi:U-scoloptoxin(01)-Cw1a-like [Oratosquilla oratoria]|uniref:U-scoloptoxin(01)-Cw1a-like n=1 Tax=Oratosquilla oratoria TaxID=337810 RepID=UPI003F75B463